jgi:hypothetical protein
MFNKNKKNTPRLDPNLIFKLLFIAVICFTFLSLLMSFFLSFQNQLSLHQTHMLEACLTIWKMGFGAIIGMLAGIVRSNASSNCL